MALHLADRAVIALWGPEAHGFLNGLVTNDIAGIEPENPVYAALLTPQGKILFDFFVTEREEVLFIDCPKAKREALMKRLTMYKLRARIDMLPRDDIGVFTGEGRPDPRLPALGLRMVSPLVPAEPGDEAYLAQRLELGVPEGDDFGSDRMFALDAGLDELNAISFDKGCYVGQELTARMKHRGKDRKRLLPLRTTGGKPLPARDVPVMRGGVEIGAVTSSYGECGFALVRLDRLDSSEGALDAAGVEITVAKPAWLFT